MIQFLKKYSPSLIVIAVIAYATLYPDPLPDDDMQLFPHFDKLIHAIMFGGMAGALAFDYRRSANKLSKRAMLACCAIAAGYGLLTEILQIATGMGRSGDLCDFVADCIGIAVAYFSAPPATKALLRRFSF